MSTIIAGTIRVPSEHLTALRPHMIAMREASRAEPGCVQYSYAEDIAEPGLIHVFEVWRDDAAIAAHFAAPHMTRWRAAWPAFGVSDRRLIAYEVAGQRPL